jgi:hypothetical protein
MDFDETIQNLMETYDWTAVAIRIATLFLGSHTYTQYILKYISSHLKV